MAMETILGIKGLDFVMLACDTMQAKSIIFMKDDLSKIHRLSEYAILAAVGDGGDTLQFTDYIARHLQLYKINNGYHLSPRAAAHYTRKNLADYIRTNTRYQVSMLLAGYDAIEGPNLHYIDSYGALQSIDHAGHGMGSLFCGSIFQRYWKSDLKHAEAYDILKMCVAEIQKRLVINLRNFDVFVVDQSGTQQLESINPSTFLAETQHGNQNAKSKVVR